MARGMDVSTHQKSIDWAKVKASGIDFVMLRATWGTYTDGMFLQHIAGALSAGLNVGVYGFSIAESVEQARAEAQALIALIKPYKLTYPVCMDAESEKDENKRPIGLINLDKATRTDCCIAYLEEIEKAGYYAMLYSSKDWLQYKLDYSRLTPYDIWLAEWDIPSPTWKGPYGIWQPNIQFVDGAGNVDNDVSYKDYPSIIRNAGLNGFSKIQPTLPQPESVAPAPQPEPIPHPTPAPQQENYITYKVQPGDSFWQIAQAKLGNGNRYMEIVNFNSMTAQTVIHPGDVLKIPCGQSAPAPQPTAQRTYTVKPGDSYWAIAQSQLGNGIRWTEIKALNGNKEVIHPGDVLKIPN